MGRPSKPIISRSAVIEVALDIIAREGLEALSIRRIADEIGVNGASLYHHFKNKDEIVIGTAELALAKTPLRLPDGKIDKWQDLLCVGALQLRDFLLAHPELVSVIIRRRSEGFANRFLEHATERLLDTGMPVEIIAPLYEALERFTIGSVVRQIAEGDAARPRLSAKQFPLLAKAASKQKLTPERIFEISIEGITGAFERYAEAAGGARPRKTGAVKKPRRAGNTLKKNP